MQSGQRSGQPRWSMGGLVPSLLGKGGEMPLYGMEVGVLKAMLSLGSQLSVYKEENGNYFQARVLRPCGFLAQVLNFLPNRRYTISGRIYAHIKVNLHPDLFPSS